MFNWFKRKEKQPSAASSKERMEDQYELHLKKLRTKSPASLYAMATRVRPGTSAAQAATANRKRMDAVLVLKYHPSAETSEVLQRVIADDPEYLVRYHAVRALLLIHGYDEKDVERTMAELAPRLGYQRPTVDPDVLPTIQRLIDGRPAATTPAK